MSGFDLFSSLARCSSSSLSACIMMDSLLDKLRGTDRRLDDELTASSVPNRPLEVTASVVFSRSVLSIGREINTITERLSELIIRGNGAASNSGNIAAIFLVNLTEYCRIWSDVMHRHNRLCLSKGRFFSHSSYFLSKCRKSNPI